MILLLAFLALLGACVQDIQVAKQKVDNDGDGYSAEVDCDDGRGDVNPEGVEACNGRDDDCDSQVDEEATDAATWFADTDVDGFGDAASGLSACDAPEGYVSDATDCDDTRADVSPEASETCDHTDDDCDGAVDEADATDAGTWYPDDDGDGWGDTSQALTACDGPEGYVASGGDCDEADPAVHPDAEEGDCTDPTDYNCDGSVGWADADLDGWAACEDCDDADGARSPGATEVCDEADVDEDCSGLADDADAGVDPSTRATWTRDVDGDAFGGDGAATSEACDQPTGFAAVAGDCDDAEPTVNPAVTEVCDAADIDEDCDGLVDDADASTDVSTWTTWSRDADEDTYGDASRSVSTCDAPAGYVGDGTDCDDTRADVSPGAEEMCDADDVDEDCDGLADDDDGSAGGESAWYADADGDGHGDGGLSVDRCDAPPAYVESSDDCDDGDAAISPSDLEVCDAADVDEDCDGLADDADASVTGTSSWYTDADLDGYGDAGAPVSACDLPSGASADATDCDDANAAVSPAGSEVCNAIDDDCDGLADEAGASGETSWYRDADSDGYGAGAASAACEAPAGYVAVATDCDDATAAVSPSAVEVCDDGVDADCDGLIDEGCGFGASLSASDADALIYGESSGSSFGQAVAGGFDFDGDGVEDLVVGSPGDDGGGSDYGAAYVYAGDVDAGPADADTNELLEVYGTSTYTSLGMDVVGVPDLDGDGDDELFVLSYTATWWANRIPGGLTGSMSVTAADDAVFNCEAVAWAGSDDWMCGESGSSGSTGRVYVYSGLSTTIGTLAGESTDDYLGASVAGGHDIDGDGVGDLLVGARGDDDVARESGAAYVVYGPVSGTMAADVKIRGTGLSQYLGHSVHLAEDLDGDGDADPVVGAWADSTGGSSAGAVYVFSSTLSSTVSASAADATFHGTTGDWLGYHRLGIVSTGDVDGDGQLDLLLASPQNDGAGANAGRAWLVYGPLSGTYDLTTDADTVLDGDAASDRFGYDGTIAGDLDRDGADDVVIGASAGDGPSAADYGALYVFYGG